jgi:NAD-dependent SIR2 family protein deacetylase
MAQIPRNSLQPTKVETARPDLDTFYDQLEETLRPARRWLVITGAGLSAASGIPTYRDDNGNWLRSDPIQHQDFIQSAASRQSYWARSMVGWPIVARAIPNRAHRALVELEAQGRIAMVVTQNVDRLHQDAGQQRVIDLHGRLDRVRCRGCGRLALRSELQRRLLRLNPAFSAPLGHARPDGDADVDPARLSGFRVPVCHFCDGVLMPDVVFFGGSVGRRRVANVTRMVEAADALLVAGSSLTVFSGFRFCRLAQQLGKPVVVVNRGVTRADCIASVKVPLDCSAVLPQLVTRLSH